MIDQKAMGSIPSGPIWLILGKGALFPVALFNPVVNGKLSWLFTEYSIINMGKVL